MDINESKQMVINLKIIIETHYGEQEDEVFKHLSNILYDNDSDIKDIS